MKRELTSHRVEGLNEQIQVSVLDDPGPGGACHRYRVCVPMLNPAEAYPEENSRRARTYCDINFQLGPIKEAGVNGITVEALLAVVEDRLSGFQSGQFSCRENAVALTKIQEAMMWLQKRTRDRVARGVEGVSAK